MSQRIKSILFFLIFAIGLSGCQIGMKEKEVAGESGYYYYIINKDATQLVKEPYNPEKNDISFMIDDLLTHLGSKNSEEKTISLLPQEVTVHTYTWEAGVLTIDFNSQYSKMGRTRELLVRAGIVKTFMQFPGINAIQFTVNGEALTDSKQQVIGEMTDQTFLEYSGTSDLDNYRYETLILFFTDAEGSGLVKETRRVYYKPSLPKERVVLEQLLKGPMEKGNYPTVAENTTVLNISTSDDICYVSFDQSFVDSALELDEELTVYSVVNSLVESCGVRQVELSIEGNTDVTFGETMSLYKFYEENEDLILANK